MNLFLGGEVIAVVISITDWNVSLGSIRSGLRITNLTTVFLKGEALVSLHCIKRMWFGPSLLLPEHRFRGGHHQLSLSLLRFETTTAFSRLRDDSDWNARSGKCWKDVT